MEIKNRHNIRDMLFAWNNFKIKLVLESTIIGILTGFVIVLFRISIEMAGTNLIWIYTMLSSRHWLIPIWILLLIIIGVIIGKMVKSEPMISGSGIPQVEGILLRQFDMNWLSVILGKFFGGVLSIGAGLSLGREGPSVQLGACVGQGFSRIFKRVRVEEKYLITSGASAGLAAAFNAPLAGAVFALEEVHKNFSPLVLLSALSAAISSNFIASEFFGLKPVFSFENLSMLPLKYYYTIVILGLVLGFTGVFFNKFILFTQNLYSRLTGVFKDYKMVIPLLISVIPGFLLPQVLGGGNKLISLLANGDFTLKILLILLIIKFLFTMISFGSGAPGGIFLPLLTIGALIGCLYGNLLVYFFSFDSRFINNFIILAMAGYFTAVVRAPITGTILITEMTGSFTHLFSLSLISIIAYIVADALRSIPIYESLLDKLINNNIHPALNDNKFKSILEIPVCVDSYLDRKRIKDIKWPAQCLVVGVRRGQNEKIPKGNTVIYPGDYLTILTDEYKVTSVNAKLQEMCNSH